MRLAIVCDDLIQHGGAEEVLKGVSDLFPDAPIYTSVASKKWFDYFNSKKRTVKTSFLQRFPFSVSLNRYYSAFLLHVLAFESFDFSSFDIVLSLSSRYSHFVVTKPSTKHICYMHSPGRMFWEPFEYFERESYGFLKPFKFLSKSFLKLPLMYMRLADFNASKKVDIFLANSINSQKRIKKYYGMDSQVLYPFIDMDMFKDKEEQKQEQEQEQEQESKVQEGVENYLVITRLVSWKKVDTAIEACTKLNEKLKIIGEGPDKERLRLKSGSNIEFLGYIDDDRKIEEIKKCKALIFTQKEDFGIVPLEVMACGKPVIAFGKGGVVETVIPGKTGEFFFEQNAESLESVLKVFDPKKYSSYDCRKRAGEFDIAIFRDKIKDIVNNV